MNPAKAVVDIQTFKQFDFRLEVTIAFIEQKAAMTSIYYSYKLPFIYKILKSNYTFDVFVSIILLQTNGYQGSEIWSSSHYTSSPTLLVKEIVQ